MSAPERIIALHRYYIWANRMREHFDRALKSAPQKGGHLMFADDHGLFMSYWYGALYVVVEGYQELGLSDPAIDKLLDSPNVSLLKRYRNGTFHFQATYFDERFADFIQAEDAVPWVRALSTEFGRFLLHEVGKLGAQADPGTAT